MQTRRGARALEAAGLPRPLEGRRLARVLQGGRLARLVQAPRLARVVQGRRLGRVVQPRRVACLGPSGNVVRRLQPRRLARRLQSRMGGHCLHSRRRGAMSSVALTPRNAYRWDYSAATTLFDHAWRVLGLVAHHEELDLVPEWMHSLSESVGSASSVCGDC